MSDSAHLFCCPICSALPPDGVSISPGTEKSYFCQPVIWHGRRSKKFWIVPRLGCEHGPAPAAGADQSSEIVAAWNAWAKSEAEAKAERLKFSAARRSRWLYHLGVIGLTEILK